MNAFFDNCTSPTLAATIAGYVGTLGHLAVHIRDSSTVGLDLNRDATDLEWIIALGADVRGWIVVTGDRKLSRNKAEKEAFRRARLSGLWLSGPFTRLPVHRQAALLINRWPDLAETIRRFNPPLLIAVPTRFGGKLDLIQW